MKRGVGDRYLGGGGQKVMDSFLGRLHEQGKYCKLPQPCVHAHQISLAIPTPEKRVVYSQRRRRLSLTRRNRALILLTF